MKKYIRVMIAALAVTMAASGCGKNGGSKQGGESTTEVASYDDMTPKLDELKAEIDALKEQAEKLHSEGKLDDEKYNAVMGLDERFNAIGKKEDSENKLKYNELKQYVEELKYSLSAAEDPQKTDNMKAATSLMERINEVEPAIKGANESGKLSNERLAQFNSYKEEVQGYIDGTREQNESTLQRLADIRSDITTMASQAEVNNAEIDKLLAEPATVEDNTKLEELVSNYIDLQNEVTEKVNNKELTEDKLTELMTIGVKVAKVKEALSTGDITEETRNIMTECNKELKTYAEGIGSSSAEYFK